MKTQKVIWAVALGAILLAGCQPPPPRSISPTPNDVPTKPSAATTLIIGMPEEPDVLNPYTSAMFTTQKILYGVMNPLLSFDPKLNIVPALAESYSISADGLVYTFKLRKGVKWHDGQPFRAQDVQATWQTIMDPKFGALSTSGYDKIQKIDTPDDFTAVVTLKEKYAPILAIFASTLICPKHLIEKGIDSFKQEFGRNPIGTGAFRFVGWEPGQRIELARNEAYFGVQPQLERIVVKFVPDTNTLITQLQTGEIQMTDALNAVDYEAVKGLPLVNVSTLTGLNYTHIDLKNIDFLRDKRVRQALDFATPREQIIDQLLKGLAVVAVADQSPVTPYFNATIQPRPYNLERATTLLAEARFTKNGEGILEKEGKPLVIEYWVSAGDKQAKLVQQVVAASWRKLGVDVQEREQDIRTWMTADGIFYRKTMTANQYEWYLYPDPDNVSFWHSSAIPKEPGSTGTNFPAVYFPYEQQAEFNSLTTAGVSETDPQKRIKIYQDLQELLHEEVPVIFLYWGKRVFVAPKTLSYDTNAALPLLFNVETWGYH